MIRNNMTNPPLTPSNNDAPSPGDQGPDDARAKKLDRLLAQAQLVRATIGSKRSDKLLRLFDFLLERTVEGRPPTEIDIANEAFSIGKTIEAPQDATVRVYVHRLRKALDAYYADNPGPRLFIPKGEYALLLSSAEEEAEVVVDGPDKPAVDDASAPRRRLAWLALAAVLALNVAAWWWFLPPPSDAGRSALASTPLWNGIVQDNRPITVVLGDYYLFAEAMDRNGDGATEQPRLIRDPAINAREDLDVYLMAHPEEMGRISDLDMRYVPSGAAVSLGDVADTLRALKGDSGRRTSLIPASQLTADILKSSDIIYIGQLSGLGTLLRNALFQASGFKVGATYDELIDSASGRRFQSDGGLVLAEERLPRRDFGYIASLPGPTGNPIVIIAGTRDAGLRQMAEFVRDPRRLDALGGPQIARADGFEALYQVRTMGSLNISGQMLMMRPLRSRGIWDRSTPSQRFPDDTYEGEGRRDR